ncbi:MAG: hypothetical protein MMC33_007080 [Icmadophila ericetorum]|nr:hypothetical protein [Icmadophila ericetorum]
MSEYWKSTPKFWCKHCKIYVRDTKIEKQNHEATPKHQGNLKRFLRDLHRGHEKDEREKQRAKDEVARLNGAPPPERSVAGGSLRKAISAPSSSASQKIDPAEQKRRLAQLAEMGIAVPEEFRKEMAMAGDWKILSEQTIDDPFKEEDSENVKPSGLNIGVRKRRLDEAEEELEEQQESHTKRKVWGSTMRTYPGARDTVEDLDQLLTATAASVKKEEPIKQEESHDIPQVPVAYPTEGGTHRVGEPSSTNPKIKKEESSEGLSLLDADTVSPLDPAVKVEETTEISNPFKKRKPKAVKQR